MSPREDDPGSERERRRATRAGRPRDASTSRKRARKRRRVPAVLALLGVLVALVAGILLGYQARGDDPPAGLVTVERPVVVVTVPETQ